MDRAQQQPTRFPLQESVCPLIRSALLSHLHKLERAVGIEGLVVKFLQQIGSLSQ
jgi:hypothetical protein